jgi:hypothetical protein
LAQTEPSSAATVRVETRPVSAALTQPDRPSPAASTPAEENTVQKVGAQFVVKKISDYVMASPPQADEAPEEAQEQAAQQAAPNLDGQVIKDEEGQSLGVARRVANVAVYVVTDRRAGLEEQLKATIADPEGKVFFHHAADGTLTGLIYVPDPSSRPAPVSVTRPDDI